MRYMLIMRVTDAAVEATKDVDFAEIVAAMGRYNERLVEAGVLLSAEGLSDASEGFVVHFTDDEPLVTDGPYGEIRELFNGFWILEVASKAEAVEWAKRVPLGPDTSIEVRRVTELSDFDPENGWIEKEQGWRDGLAADAATGAEQQA